MSHPVKIARGAYTISTAKGSHTGTLQSCVDWQCEYQGSYPTITFDDDGPASVDVMDVDFDADNMVATLEQVERAFLAEGYDFMIDA